MITTAAVFFAVILSTLAESLKQGIFDNLVKNVVSFYTGYIQVHKLGYQDEQVLENSFPQSPQLSTGIHSISYISGVTPRLESFALASSGNITQSCMVSGISPAAEDKVTGLRQKLTAGSYLDDHSSAALVAEGLAERLQLKLGDSVILIAQGYHGATAAGRFRVGGILKLGSPQLNDRILYLSLPAAQAFFSAEGMITSYILTIEETEDLYRAAAAVKTSVGGAYEVLTWEELLPDIKQHISTDSNNMKFVQGFLYVLISFGIFSTLLMMMLERKYEIGMLVAIGMKKSRLMLLFVAESVLTVVTGCLAGIIASMPLVFYFYKHPIRIGGDTASAYERFGFEPVFPTAITGSIFFYQALTVLLIGLLLSLYPVIKIIRLHPVTAMKKM